MLEDVNGEILRIMIDFCYSGKIEINSDNVDVLLAASLKYKFTMIKKKCAEFLEQSLKSNPLNCLASYSLAYWYNLDGLKKLSKQLLCTHFMKFRNHEKFLQLNFIQLFEVIRNDNLNVPREEDAFNTVMKWIDYDKISRKKYMVDLYKVIRFSLMEASVRDNVRRYLCLIFQFFNNYSCV